MDLKLSLAPTLLVNAQEALDELSIPLGNVKYSKLPAEEDKAESQASPKSQEQSKPGDFPQSTEEPRTPEERFAFLLKGARDICTKFVKKHFQYVHEKFPKKTKFDSYIQVVLSLEAESRYFWGTWAWSLYNRQPYELFQNVIHLHRLTTDVERAWELLTGFMAWVRSPLFEIIVPTQKILKSPIGTRFKIKDILANGDCGYTAYGIERKDAHALLKANIHDEVVRVLLKNPVIVALRLQSFVDYLKGKKLAGLPEALSLEYVEQNIESLSENGDIVSAFIDYDVMLKRDEPGHGWIHPFMLQALAHLQKAKLCIWRRGSFNQLVPHRTPEGDFSVFEPENPKREIHLLFINNDHFDRLETLQPKEGEIPFSLSARAEDELQETFNRHKISFLGTLRELILFLSELAVEKVTAQSLKERTIISLDGVIPGLAPEESLELLHYKLYALSPTPASAELVKLVRDKVVNDVEIALSDLTRDLEIHVNSLWKTCLREKLNLRQFVANKVVPVEKEATVCREKLSYAEQQNQQQWVQLRERDKKLGEAERQKFALFKKVSERDETIAKLEAENAVLKGLQGKSARREVTK